PRLGHRLGEDRRGEHGDAARARNEVALVGRDVLQAHDPTVLLELEDPVHEQERMAMGKDPLDVLELERQLQFDRHRAASLQRGAAGPRGTMPGVRPVESVKPGPPLPSEILGELLPLVREINAVLDPEALLPAIATQLRRIVGYRLLDIFLPGPDGLLYPAFVEGYAQEESRRFRLKLGEG